MDDTELANHMAALKEDIVGLQTKYAAALKRARWIALGDGRGECLLISQGTAVVDYQFAAILSAVSYLRVAAMTILSKPESVPVIPPPDNL